MRVALRGLATRRLRAALTAVAIVLGVALVAGTFVLTDSITGAFGSIFSTIYQGTDATVSGRSVIDSSANGGVGGGGADVPPFSQSLLARVQALPGVKEAIGDVSGSLQVVVNGKAITSGGAPNLGFSVDPAKPQFSSLKLVSGSWPGPNGVVIDTHTASTKNLHAGDVVGVQGVGAVQRLRISGLVKFGSASSLGGATLAGLQLPTAQRLLGRVGKLDEIRASAKSGVTPTQLVDQIRPILPRDTQVRTGAQQAQKDTSSVNSFLSFLKTFLLVFAGVALFVGSFVIANSLSITIAQRTREFATLRTLGASRRQVRRSILVESLVIGAIASVVGLLVGLLLAQGLFALFNSAGLTLPNTGTVVKPRTIIVAIVVGVVVTVLASLRPAIRATRVEPIAAVREGATIPEGRLAKYRFVMSAATALLGVVALALGLFVASGTGGVLILMGLGAVLIFIGVALLSARIVPTLANWLGWPATKIAGSIGQLARENTMRNPQRTASTASALMIGLALVTFVTVLSAGIIANFKNAVNDVFTGNYAITAQNNFSPIPISAGQAATRAPGVIAVGDVRAGQGRVLGKNEQLTAVNPTIGQVVRLRWKHGSQAVLATLGANGAFIDDGYASSHHLSVGSPVVVTSPTGQRIPLVVRGIFKPPSGGSPFGPVTMSAATWDRAYPQPQNLYTLVKMQGGQSAANQAALKRVMSAFPNAKVQTREQFINNQISGLSSVLNILYVLLALSIIVSLFGIVNTLVLSVFERTREIGMLRAVGTSRRQVRRMIRHESVITALIGSVLGIILGIVFGALLAARDSSSIAFVIPVGRIIIFLIASWIVGLLAAIFPARRAAKLNPLQALAYE
ncbi:MAG TPA: FtsX-like permease family protein [Solirubrobacteraceae bacterium]|nr:FtsX-like permease family protein [Solirubrobacteraceae bacterium]